MTGDRPPRPLAVGDVVAVHSEALGAWTASQITGIDASTRCAAVLELDWSGPEPAVVADLGDVRPLRLTHHSWRGELAHCNQGWVLPRSFKVIGSLPPLVSGPCHAYAMVWQRGENLARQRHWDSGNREDWHNPYELECTAGEPAAEDTRGTPRAEVRHLTVRGVTRLDCARLVADFPALTSLSLSGDLGTLTSAAALNRFPLLRALWIDGLFGMNAGDCLLPRHVPLVEDVRLDGIPADYAAAMRRAWRPQARHGVHLEVRGARPPGWVAANRDNPLRDWDGRGHIPPAAYRKAVAAYEAARDAFLAAVTAGERHGSVAEIGDAFGTSLNELDLRAQFIETVEREELFDALDFLVDETQTRVGRDLSAARAALIEAVDAVRDW